MKKNNIYIIRKAVKAKSMKEALQKEKLAPILDIILSVGGGDNQLMPAIGFMAAQNTEDDE